VVEQHEAELRALYGASGMDDLVAQLGALVETLDSAPSTAPEVPAPA
jgi:hypothetical protein